MVQSAEILSGFVHVRETSMRRVIGVVYGTNRTGRQSTHSLLSNRLAFDLYGDATYTQCRPLP